MKFYASIMMLLILMINKPALAEQDKAFELPRTKVVRIQDAGTKRFYELHIQLPKNYTEGQKYPVIYMTDSPYTFPITTGAARYPINFDRMENLFFVGISWEVGHSAGLSRQRDYTPTSSSPGFKDPAGEAVRHLAFVRDNVIPYVEKNFTTDSSNRTYIGNSFGGLFGLYILLTQPDTFKNYVIGSPSIWWDNKYILKLESKTKLPQLFSANIFISVGAEETKSRDSPRNDMVGDAKEFHARLKARKLAKVNLELQVIESANHSTAFPTTAIQGLWWLFNKDDKVETGVAN